MLVNRQSPFFDKEAAYRLYKFYEQEIDYPDGFEDLTNRDSFYNVYEGGKFVGCIFVYKAVDGLNYLGGFANRGMHRQAVRAVCDLCKNYDLLYSETPHLNAVICLKKAGFEWLDRRKKLLIWRNNNGQETKWKK